MDVLGHITYHLYWLAESYLLELRITLSLLLIDFIVASYSTNFDSVYGDGKLPCSKEIVAGNFLWVLSYLYGRDL